MFGDKCFLLTYFGRAEIMDKQQEPQKKLYGRLQLHIIKGAQDMLKESAKQFRLNANPGHATLCEMHAAQLEVILEAVWQPPLGSIISRAVCVLLTETLFERADYE